MHVHGQSKPLLTKCKNLCCMKNYCLKAFLFRINVLQNSPCLSVYLFCNSNMLKCLKLDL